MAEPVYALECAYVHSIHGVITLSHRDSISLIQTSQRSSRTSLRFDRKGALRGELTNIYTSHPVMTLWITMLGHSFQRLHMHTPLQYGLITCSLTKSLSAQILTGLYTRKKMKCVWFHHINVLLSYTIPNLLQNTCRLHKRDPA